MRLLLRLLIGSERQVVLVSGESFDAGAAVLGGQRQGGSHFTGAVGPPVTASVEVHGEEGGRAWRFGLAGRIEVNLGPAALSMPTTAEAARPSR